MKKVFTLVLFFVSSFSITHAQQYPVIGQYMFNKLFINPAYAGTNESFNANFLVRKQWFSASGQFAGAPTTTILNMDAPIQNQRAGIGGTIYYDQLGVMSETFVAINYSYRLPLTSELTMAMGLRGGVGFVKANYDNKGLNVQDKTDTQFETQGKNNQQFSPKIGAGLYLYHPKYYLGFSVPDLMVYDKYSFYKYKDTVSGQERLTRNMIFTAGANLFLSDIANLQPNVLIKYYKTQPLFIDLNCNILLHEKILFGVSARPFNSSFVLQGQLKVSDKIKVGFASEQRYKNSLPGSLGSYELLLTYGIE
ncbi:MAG: type IX secretion system membrane protein PorP/SprF [Cytophagales bacterium]|nr:MAG: type IX secretion system membrane protein PorP/SprF [Cytophagales bacterium]